MSQTATWNGITSYVEFVPFGATQETSVPYQVNTFGTLTVSNPNAPQGLTATFQITNPITYTLTTNSSVYELGQPVQISITETNTSDQTVDLPGNGASELSILYNGTSVIAHSFAVWQNAFPYPINAGQSITTDGRGLASRSRAWITNVQRPPPRARALRRRQPDRHLPRRIHSGHHFVATHNDIPDQPSDSGQSGYERHHGSARL